MNTERITIKGREAEAEILAGNKEYFLCKAEAYHILGLIRPSGARWLALAPPVKGREGFSLPDLAELPALNLQWFRENDWTRFQGPGLPEGTKRGAKSPKGGKQ